jgi:peptide/nickel transport system substrate-binding protein
MVLEPPHLDPTANAAAAIKEIGYQNIFEGLTRMNDSGEVLPGLARSWDISEDGTVYTFHLAEGVTFHDGTPFSAEDVKFSLDRARAEDSTNPQKGLFAAIENVEVIDDTTVEVTLSSPQGNFLFNMAWGEAAIVAGFRRHQPGKPDRHRPVQVRQLGPRLAVTSPATKTIGATTSI